MLSNFKTFLVSLFIWSFIIITLIPLFILYMLVWVVVFPFDRRHAVTHWYTMVWTRLYLTFNPGWRLSIENRHRIKKDRNYILVSNHQSIIDIALLMQLRINFKWVSKIELARVPFVGWVIWMNGHILVKRGDRDSVVQMADACKKALENGVSVFMFPEGTRTHNGHLQPFREGAFILAKTNHVPILPVIIDGAGEALPRHGLRFKITQKFTVRVLDEIPVDTIESYEIGRLMEYTTGIMAGELTAIRNNLN